MSDTTNLIREYRSALRAEQEANDTYKRAAAELDRATEALTKTREHRNAAYEALMAEMVGDIVEVSTSSTTTKAGAR